MLLQANSSYHRSVQDSLAAYSSPASRLQSQYSLFLNNSAASSRLQAAQAATVKAEVPWCSSSSVPSDYHTPASADFAHHLDRNYSPHPYTNMPSAGNTTTTISETFSKTSHFQLLSLQRVRIQWRIYIGRHSREQKSVEIKSEIHSEKTKVTIMLNLIENSSSKSSNGWSQLLLLNKTQHFVKILNWCGIFVEKNSKILFVLTLPWLRDSFPLLVV